MGAQGKGIHLNIGNSTFEILLVKENTWWTWYQPCILEALCPKGHVLFWLS